MGDILELEESDFAGYIDHGEIYDAQVLTVRKEQKPFHDKVTGEAIFKYVFRFQLITEDDHDGQSVYGETSTTFTDHPGCKLKTWSEQIVGRRFPPRYRLNTDDLQDRRCRLMIGKGSKIKEGSGEVFWNYVLEVMSTRENAAALATEPTEPF